MSACRQLGQEPGIEQGAGKARVRRKIVSNILRKGRGGKCVGECVYT
jgi:hypothetical protein